MKAKRFLSILLALTMVLTTISIGVFADEGAIANSGASATGIKLGTNGVTATELPEAVNGVITLTENVKLSETFKVNEGTTVTIDLAGYEITVTKNEETGRSLYAIDNYGTLTLKDSVGEGKITARGVENFGTMTVESGAIVSCDANGGAAIWNEGTLTINDGMFTTVYEGTSSDTSGPGCLNNSGTAVINKGTFTSVNNRAYAVISGGTITLEKDVTVTGPQGALAISGGTAIINGGTYTCTDKHYGLYVSSGVVTVNGGTFEGGSVGNSVCVNTKTDESEDTEETKITINNGDFTGNISDGNNNVTITGGTFKEDKAASSAVAVIGTTYYTSLADAVATATEEGISITLLDNVYGGLDLGKNDPTKPTTINIDLNGKTWYAGNPTVGSTNTVTNGIRVLAGGKVTIKNGTINLDNEEGKCKVGIANYDTLTLEDVTIETGNNTALMYTINNRGALELKGETTVPSATAEDGPKIAITNDPYDYFYTGEGSRNATLTVADEKVVVGNVLLETYGNETNNGIPELNISAGTFGDVAVEDYDSEKTIGVKVSITGGTFDSVNIETTEATTLSITGGKFDSVSINTESEESDISVTGGEFKELTVEAPENVEVEVSDNVTIMPDDAVTKIGNVGYSSLDKAIAAAEKNSTLTLIADASITDEASIDTLKTNNITLKLGNYSLTASKALDPRDYISVSSGYKVSRNESDDDTYVYTIVRIPSSRPTGVTSNNNNNNSSSNNNGGSYTGGTVSDNTTTDTTVTLPFVDVTDGDWFYDYIEYAYDNKLMNGMSETEFAPNTAMSRAMLVTILYRLAGSPEVVTTETEWYSAGQTWAMEKAISDGTNMTDEITREQLAAMLYRYAGMIGADTTASGDITIFTDAESVSEYATDAVAWAVANELVNGMGDGTFAPQSSATRAQVAAIFTRAADILK